MPKSVGEEPVVRKMVVVKVWPQCSPDTRGPQCETILLAKADATQTFPGVPAAQSWIWHAEAFAGYLQSGSIPTFLEDDLSVWKTWITDQQITDYNMKACWNRTHTSCIHWCSLMDSSFRHLENLAQQIRPHRIIRQLKSLCYVIHKCSKGA